MKASENNATSTLFEDKLEYEEGLDILELLKALWGGKWLIILLSSLSGLLGYFYVINLPDMYRASVLVTPVGEGGQGGIGSIASQYGGLASLAGVSLPSSEGSSVQEAIALVKTRKFALQFIDEQELFPVLFSEYWDDELGQWKSSGKRSWLKSILVGQLPSDKSRVFQPSSWSAYAIYQDAVSISQNKENGLVSLSVEWIKPELAAEWANLLVDKINFHAREEKRLEAEKNMLFLNQQVNQTSVVEFQKVLFNLIENQAKTIMLASAQDEFIFKVLDPAVPPESPIRPKRSAIFSLSVLLGAILGFFITLTKYFLIQNVKRH